MQDEVKMIDHVVSEEDLANNPDLADEGVKAGDTIQIPEEPTQADLEQKLNQELGLEADIAEAAPAEAPAAKSFKGQSVISDGFREVNGKNYHHIRLADGSSLDLSEEEYVAQVI